MTDVMDDSALSSTLLGTHPVHRQSPPIRSRSTSSRLAPNAAAVLAAARPAVPPPTYCGGIVEEASCPDVANRSARCLIPASILRSMIKLPGSIRYLLTARIIGDASGVAIRFRLISRVPDAAGRRQNVQIQLPSSDRMTSARCGSKTATCRVGP